MNVWRLCVIKLLFQSFTIVFRNKAIGRSLLKATKEFEQTKRDPTKVNLSSNGKKADRKIRTSSSYFVYAYSCFVFVFQISESPMQTMW